MKTRLGTCLFLTSMMSWAQGPHPTDRTDRAKAHDQMHQRLRESLIRGDDIMQTMRAIEESMDQLMREAGEDMHALTQLTPRSARTVGGTQEWAVVHGGRQLVLTPSHPDARLEVDVQGPRISIKESLSTGALQAMGETQIPVPAGCDPNKVKMEGKDGKLVLFFPCEGAEVGAVVPGKPLKRQRK